MVRLILLLPAVLLPTMHADAQSNETLAPWGTNPHPTDAPKRHAEKIVVGRHVYLVRHGGTMDGANCRTPIGVGMMTKRRHRPDLGVQPARSAWKIRKATDVINPWLANGRNGFRTLDEIVASAIKPGMTDREKAHALWFQQIRHRYHWHSAATITSWAIRSRLQHLWTQQSAGTIPSSSGRPVASGRTRDPRTGRRPLVQCKPFGRLMESLRWRHAFDVPRQG